MREVSPKEVAYVNGCRENLIIPKLEKAHIDLKEELMHILLTIYYCNIKVIILLIIYFYMD